MSELNRRPLATLSAEYSASQNVTGGLQAPIDAKLDTAIWAGPAICYTCCFIIVLDVLLPCW